MPNLAEERRAFLVQTELVGQRGVSDRCEIDIAAFKGVGPGTTEHSIRCNDGLQDIVGSSRSQFKAPEVVSVHDIRLSILPNRDRYSADSVGAFEDAWIKECNPARS